jgi:hypothetical protein
VQAIIHQEVIGEAVADEHRSDIAAIGLGDGKCGYAITFHRPIDPLYLPFVVIKPEGGDVELPRYAPTSFVDFFTAVHRAYPAAGRNRSVLGGLWTDRTDSAALLKGKVEIGQIDPDIAGLVGQLIHQGFAMVEGLDQRLPPAIKASDHAQAAATLLGDAHILPLLRAVLEDCPVAFQAVPVGAEDTPLIQPSAEAVPLLSPAECLAVVAPLGTNIVEFDVFRGSQAFPEFTRDGLSRWTNAQVCRSTEMPALQHGLLDRYSVKPGAAAVVGPGLLYSVRGAQHANGLKLLLTAARAVPASFAREGRKEITMNGLRVWL